MGSVILHTQTIPSKGHAESRTCVTTQDSRKTASRYCIGKQHSHLFVSCFCHDTGMTEVMAAETALRRSRVLQVMVNLWGKHPIALSSNTLHFHFHATHRISLSYWLLRFGSGPCF